MKMSYNHFNNFKIHSLCDGLMKKSDNYKNFSLSSTALHKTD